MKITIQQTKTFGTRHLEPDIWNQIFQLNQIKTYNKNITNHCYEHIYQWNNKRKKFK